MMVVSGVAWEIEQIMQVSHYIMEPKWYLYGLVGDNLVSIDRFGSN
jgi:hypothetical protein